MKYSYINGPDKKRFSVAALDGGLLSDKHKDNCIKECGNMWFKDGCLATRPGMDLQENGFIFGGESFEDVASVCKNSGVRFTLNGKEYDVISLVLTDYISHYRICVFFADSNGNIINANEIKCRRLTDDEFYIPVNYFFITAAPTYGSGLYAFVTRCNNGVDYSYMIYEYVTNTEEWKILSDNDYYVPTLYINGRGSSYLTAQLNGTAYEKAPVELEPQNLIGGWFYCYFSSDGYSSDFKLPLSGLDDTTVICRVYIKADSYFEWKVLQGETESTIQFGGKDITLKCDRAAGVLQFFSGEEPFPIFRSPLFPSNNIRIEAKKTVLNGKKRIIGGTFAEAFDSRIYIGGNSEFPNEVYYSRRENPLYFPAKQSFKVGETTGTVTAVAQRAGELFFFKSDEIYKLSITQGREYDVNGFCTEKQLRLYYPDTARSILLSKGIGCINRNTVRVYNDVLMWQGNDKKIYCIPQSKNRIIHISQPIDEMILTKSNADCTALYNGFYMMFFRNNIYLLDVERSQVSSSADKQPIWFRWQLPESVYVALAMPRNGRLHIICTEDSRKFLYSAFFGAAQDNFLNGSIDDPHHEKAEIPSYFTSAFYDCDTPEKEKWFNALFLKTSFCEEIYIECNGEQFIFDEISSEQNKMQTVRINPDIKGECGMEFKVWAHKPFSVSSFVINYRELKEIR